MLNKIEKRNRFRCFNKISYSVRLYIGIIILLGIILLVMFHFFSNTLYIDLIEKREKRLLNVVQDVSNDVTREFENNDNFQPDRILKKLSKYSQTLDLFDELTVGYYDRKNIYLVSNGSIYINEIVTSDKYNLNHLKGTTSKVYRDTNLIGIPDTKGILSVNPVYYKNDVIGYVWAQSKITDIEKRTNQINRGHYHIIFIVFIVGMAGAYVINYCSRKSLLKFARDVNVLEEKTLDYHMDIPELNPLLEEIIINRRNKLCRAVINERMSTIAQLSTGLAHDIRNPLTSIKGFLQLLENRVDSNDRELIKISLEELATINGLIQDMLYLVDPPESRFELFDLTSVIKKIIEDLTPEAKDKHINLTLKSMNDIPSIPFDIEQIKLVMVNIIKNAFEAIDGSNGTIDVCIDLCNKNRNISITVADNGKGMSYQLKEKVFDPLFTTKNNGSGLGLPICREIIHRHHGMIKIMSIPGNGTKVCVYLPIDKSYSSNIIN